MTVNTENPKRARPTIVDIARISGVTKATVSKALDPTGRYALSDAVRRRVLEAAQQIGYQARSSAEDRQETVAVVYDALAAATVSGQQLTKIVSALAQESLAQRVRMVALPVVGPIDAFKRHADEHSTAGMIVVGPVDQRTERFILESQQRSVIINGFSDTPLVQVLSDAQRGAEQLAGHLVSCGHQHLFFCTGDSNPRCATLRKEGLRSAIRRAQLNEDLVIFTDVQHCLDQLSQTAARHSAIIADTCATAVELWHGCWSRGIRVPEQVSLASFEDAYPLERLTPPVTAMQAPIQQLATEAVALLLDQVHDEQSPLPRKVLVAETLVQRQSTEPKQ